MLANEKFADVSIEFAFAGETSDQFCLNKLALPTTPAPTDGSQCSSSCSTVVITGYSHEETKAQVRDTWFMHIIKGKISRRKFHAISGLRCVKLPLNSPGH